MTLVIITGKNEVSLCELFEWKNINVSEIREHLLCDGFLKIYTTWT